jgi:hypothetical protein
METKYVIRRMHGDFLESGEVVTESDKSYTVKPIEDSYLSYGKGRFLKGDVVFITNDKAKVSRMMALYIVVHKQHQAVIDAANKAYKDALAVITQSQVPKAVNTQEAQSSSQT